jgi:hypothetical protein
MVAAALHYPQKRDERRWESRAKIVLIKYCNPRLRKTELNFLGEPRIEGIINSSENARHLSMLSKFYLHGENAYWGRYMFNVGSMPPLMFLGGIRWQGD